MSNELVAAIGRVRRAMPRNADVMLICDAAERGTVAPVAEPKPRTRAPKGTFDRTTYQRNLMRARRAAAKAARL